MQNKDIRIIIDTNLWISFLITRKFSNLDKIIFSKRCTLVFSQELLDEFLDVTKREKFKRFFSIYDMEEMIEKINEQAVFVTIKSKVVICRDPKDNFLLSLALDGKADFLITGDYDLLDLLKIGETTIITMTDFLQKNK